MAAPPPVSPSEGQRQLLDNFLNHPRIARDPGKGMQRLFSHTISCLLHLSQADLWLCCLFRLHTERRCSEVPPNSRGVSLVSAFSILLFLGNHAWSQLPTWQKQDLPSSWILPCSLKTQGTLSLSKIFVLPLLPEVFKVVDSSETRLILNPSSSRAVDDSVGGELGATSEVRKRGTSVVFLEFYLTTAEPVAPQELRKWVYKFR